MGSDFISSWSLLIFFLCLIMTGRLVGSHLGSYECKPNYYKRQSLFYYRKLTLSSMDFFFFFFFFCFVLFFILGFVKYEVAV